MKQLRYQMVGDSSPLLGLTKDDIAREIYDRSFIYAFTHQSFDEWMSSTKRRINIQFGIEMIYEDSDQFVDQLEKHGLIRRYE